MNNTRYIYRTIAQPIVLIVALLLYSCTNNNEDVFNGMFFNIGEIATVTTTPITNVTGTTATTGGSVTNSGNSYISAQGVCWSTNPNPTIVDTTKTVNASGISIFISNISGLIGNTTYYVRAYATNNLGTSYGNELSFKTLKTPPIILTAAIYNITTNTAVGGGNITYDGGSPVLSSGICWNTSPNPLISDNHTDEGVVTGIFTSSINGLTPGVTYYVRSYATNSIGTTYGNEVHFTTTSLAIGVSYQGGIIAYILQLGDPGYISSELHGLIAAPSDLRGTRWYNGVWVATGAIGKALGTGNANTNTIVEVQGEGTYFAKMCYDLVLGGYSDWYLPSIDELNILYQNRAVVGGFASDIYISSSEWDSEYAWVQHFGNGYQYHNGTKSYPSYVIRAIRSF